MKTRRTTHNPYAANVLGSAASEDGEGNDEQQQQNNQQHNGSFNVTSGMGGGSFASSCTYNQSVTSHLSSHHTYHSAGDGSVGVAGGGGGGMGASYAGSMGSFNNEDHSYQQQQYGDGGDQQQHQQFGHGLPPAYHQQQHDHTMYQQPSVGGATAGAGESTVTYWSVAIADEAEPQTHRYDGVASGLPPLTLGCKVVVPLDRGVELGTVTGEIDPYYLGDLHNSNFPAIERHATAEELEFVDTELRKESESISPLVGKLIDKFGKGRMHYHGCRYQLDKSRLLVRYSYVASRVYFVSLLGSLNRQFKCRIWMVRMPWDGDRASSTVASSLDGSRQDGLETDGVTSTNSSGSASTALRLAQLTCIQDLTLGGGSTTTAASSSRSQNGGLTASSISGGGMSPTTLSPATLDTSMEN